MGRPSCHSHEAHFCSENNRIHKQSLQFPATLELSAQGSEFRMLKLEGHPVFRLSVPQIDIDFTHHLDAVTVLAPNQTKLFGMMLELRSTYFPSAGIVDSCEMGQQTNVSMQSIADYPHPE